MASLREVAGTFSTGTRPLREVAGTFSTGTRPLREVAGTFSTGTRPLCQVVAHLAEVTGTQGPVPMPFAYTSLTLTGIRPSLLAVIAAGLSLSCGHQEVRDPLAFGRPPSFEATCPATEVTAKADASTTAPVTEVMRSRNGWTVTTAGGAQRFVGLDESSGPLSDAPLGPFCQHAAQANRASAAREVDGVCILGIDRGEFGGSWMETIAPGPPPTRGVFARDNAKWILPAGADGRSLVVIGGVAHLSVSGG